jgi:pimeloyl-ACP methyl ester carboxylesterase
MKLKTILLLAGVLVLAIAIVLAALLIPVKRSGGPAAETAQAETTTQEETSMKPTDTDAPASAQMPDAATVSTVTFPTTDNLTVTADLYWTGDADKPFVILFHQARYSRGEYLEIAPKLNALGYNCLAVDQRSGNAANGITNETAKAAKAAGLSTNYPDAYPDLEAALSYVVATYAPNRLIVWGSSYSSSLVLILASEHPDEISAVLSFSPGEYFKLDDKKIADYAKNITQPVFITSAKSEEKDWRPIADQITSAGSVFFVPQANGQHGSSTLNDSASGHEEYWAAVEQFLASLK